MSNFKSKAKGTEAKAVFIKMMDHSAVWDSANYFHWINGERERVVHTIKEDRWFFASRALLWRLKFGLLPAQAQKGQAEQPHYTGILPCPWHLDNGVLAFRERGVFAYKLHWDGEMAECEGAGATGLSRKQELLFAARDRCQTGKYGDRANRTQYRKSPLWR